MKSAADVIAHAAERHRAQRAQHHVARARRRPCARARGAGTAARSGAGTSARRRIRRGACRTPAGTASRSWRARRRRARRPRAASRSPRRSCAVTASADCRTLSRSARQTRAISLEDVDEPGPSPLRRRREIRAAVERLQLGRQPDAHRPSARSGRRLHERHVDAIDVRPLFAIDLDRHEMLVEHAPRSRRSRTTRAPSRDTSDTSSSRSTERSACSPLAPSRTPRRPTETSRRDCRVLKEIRAALVRETIHRDYDIAVMISTNSA